MCVEVLEEGQAGGGGEGAEGAEVEVARGKRWTCGPFH